MSKNLIPYFGGKRRLAKTIISLMPKHDIYVEVFGGSAAVLMNKPPVRVEVYNDIDNDVVNFFRVLRNKDKLKRMRRLLMLHPYSREEYYSYIERYRNRNWEDDVEHAVIWFYIQVLSFGGMFGKSFGFSLTRSQVKPYYDKIKNGIIKAHERFKNVIIENRDWRKILELYDRENVLMYLDPPYVPYTRRDGEYKHELSIEDHKELVDKILECKSMIILSGYDNEIYNKLTDNGWNKIVIEHTVCALGRVRNVKLDSEKLKREEVIWRNPNLIKRFNHDDSLF